MTIPPDQVELRWPECGCRFPKPGPGYWDFRCLRCEGVIRFKFLRWLRR